MIRFICGYLVGSVISQGFRSVRSLSPLCRVEAPSPPNPWPSDRAYSNTTDIVAGNSGDQSASPLSPEKKEVLCFVFRLAPDG